MDMRELIKSHAENEEDRYLLSRLPDLYHAAEKRAAPAFTSFLDPRQQNVADGFLKAAGLSPFTFNGGYNQAERKIIIFYPDWLSVEDYVAGPENPIVLIRVSAAAPLTHRDYLGALLALGIKREKTGDILVDDAGCYIFLMRDMLDFTLLNFSKAGRIPLDLVQAPLSSLKIPEVQVKILTDTVASLRLDSLVSAGFSVSRGRAQELIRAGLVSVDHAPCSDSSRMLSGGEMLSVRGEGRALFASAGALSRKGRIFIEIKRFL